MQKRNSNLVIHLIWTIALLLLGLVSLLTGLASGDKINEFLSFAASLASLVLAVVAIFYSFVQSRESTQNTAKLTISAEKTELAANSIVSLTDQFKEKLDNIGQDFNNIKPSMAQMFEQFEEVKSILDGGSKPSVKSKIDSTQNLSDFLTKKSNGTVLSFYIIAKAKSHNRQFDVLELFPNDTLWQSFVAGFMQAIELCSPLGISINTEKTKIDVLNSGNLDISEIEKMLTNRASGDNVEFAMKYKQLVDNYFNGLQ